MIIECIYGFYFYIDFKITPHQFYILSLTKEICEILMLTLRRKEKKMFVVFGVLIPRNKSCIYFHIFGPVIVIKEHVVVSSQILKDV